MKLFIISCGLLCVCLAAGCQEVQQQCGNHPNLLRDKSGQIKWFEPDEMRTMAVKAAAPDPVSMAGAKYSGFVTVKIMVNTSGDVVCLWSAAGHPVMIPGAIRAVQKWKFKPVSLEGKATEFVGRVKIPVSSVPLKQ